MKWGGKDDAFAGRRDMPTTATPDKPEITEEHYSYLSAFYDLSSCRSWGMGVAGSIPYTAIINWLTFWKVDEPETYLEIIPELDNVYLEFINDKISGRHKQHKLSNARSRTVPSRQVRRSAGKNRF